MERCITSIGAWMKLDKLKLNSDKTEITVVGTRLQLDKITFDHLKVDDIEVPVATTSVRNLGAWFDCNLSMSTHINKICQSVYYHLHNIRQIGKFLTYDSTKLLVQAVIMVRVDYCNGLLYRVPAVHLSKLQHLQNTAARLITSLLPRRGDFQRSFRYIATRRYNLSVLYISQDTLSFLYLVRNLLFCPVLLLRTRPQIRHQLSHPFFSRSELRERSSAVKTCACAV